MMCGRYILDSVSNLVVQNSYISIRRYIKQREFVYEFHEQIATSASGGMNTRALSIKSKYSHPYNIMFEGKKKLKLDFYLSIQSMVVKYCSQFCWVGKKPGKAIDIATLYYQKMWKAEFSSQFVSTYRFVCKETFPFE